VGRFHVLVADNRKPPASNQAGGVGCHALPGGQRWDSVRTMIEHLYVHVPFCAAKCSYCAFYSEAGSAAKMSDYVDALLIELSQHATSLKPQTIFFGGGTPSLLPAALMQRILTAIQPFIPAATSIEWTIECNPSTVSSEKARLFRQHGVNRISMGVQALDDGLLETIGRVHTLKAALDSYDKLRAAGFDNINLDLMFGLPGQTGEHWRATLERAIALKPEHISTYCLILEEDTEFWSLFQKGLLLPNEEQETAMYQMAIEMLAAAGYGQYEISNFALPGRESRHNIAYWEGKDYIGLGPSACSTVGERRWQNVPDIDRYATGLRNGHTIRHSEETISLALRASERAAFGLRMMKGVPGDLVRHRWQKEIAALSEAGLVHWQADRLQLTARGILFADTVATEFV
jgi:oxygen-independent coproporphyrinogen-3 oxidase